MKKRTPRKSMRKFYEQQTGRKLPVDFDVHHIDFNPQNNDIRNLLAIPTKLHAKYHSTFSSYYLNETFFIPQPWQYTISPCEIDVVLDGFKKMRDVYAELSGWYNYRNGLLKIINNFVPYKEFSY